MAKKSSIIRGTLILTMTGFLSRFMGFFYRIFMSHSFGEEGVGLYQLIFPVYALCYSLTTAGIETAISRTVACKVSLGKEQEAHHVLYTGLLFSFFLSCISTIFLQDHAAYIANQLLGDARCQQLLVILSYTMPGALTIDRADRPDHLGIFLLFHDPKTRRYRLDCRCGRRTRTW